MIPVMVEPTSTDVEAAGRPFPVWDGASDYRTHLQACREWWLDVAEQTLNVAAYCRRNDLVGLAGLMLGRAERARDASRDYKAVA